MSNKIIKIIFPTTLTINYTIMFKFGENLKS